MKAVFKKEKGNIEVNVGILMSITAGAALKKGKNSHRRTIKNVFATGETCRLISTCVGQLLPYRCKSPGDS